MRTLHLLGWPIWAIIEHLDEFKNQGFDSIQITPVQPLKEEGPGEWWLPYQPVNFEIGNWFGSKEDLCRLCNETSIRGMRTFVDVVCNHLASQPFTGSLEPHDSVPDKYKRNPNFWKPKRNVTNWNNRNEVISLCMGLPGLNISNDEVQHEIFKFLDELVKCGVKGFRFDAAKSIGLPEEGVHFWDRIANRYKTLPDFEIYGEVIFGSTELIDAYGKYMKVLTNIYQGRHPENVILFAESHDSFNDEGLNKYSNSWTDEQVAYKYRDLCDRFENTMYYARPNNDHSWNNPIVKDANNRGQKIKVLYR